MFEGLMTDSLFLPIFSLKEVTSRQVEWETHLFVLMRLSSHLLVCLSCKSFCSSPPRTWGPRTNATNPTGVQKCGEEFPQVESLGGEYKNRHAKCRTTNVHRPSGSSRDSCNTLKGFVEERVSSALGKLPCKQLRTLSGSHFESNAPKSFGFTV